MDVMRLLGGSVATREGRVLTPVSPLDGTNGLGGWSPVLAAEEVGVARYLRVADWMGGTGAKPVAGMYIGTTGYVVDRAAATDFNARKRTMHFSGVTAATGIAAISFGGAFASPPTVIILPAQPALVVGGSRSELVAGSLTADGCQVKVTGAALLSSLVVALTGATANVLAIET